MADVTIAGAAITTPSSNMGVGNTGATWLSYMSSADFYAKNFYPTAFQKYGRPRGVFIRDILRAKGAERNLPGVQPYNMNLPESPANDLRVVEELNWERPIILRDDVVASTAGAAYTIYLDENCYQGTGGAPPCQERDIIQIPADYLQSGENQSASYIIMAVADDVLTGDKLTIRPLPGTNSKIDTTIPAGTYLAVSYNAYGPGEGQPKGKNTYPIDYTYKTGIIKSTYALEEEVLATKMDVPSYDGVNYLINEETARMERDLEIKEDWMLLTGQKNNDSTNLRGTSGITGEATVLKSCDGLYTILNDQGMCAYYDSSFSTDHLDAMYDGFISQYLNPTSVAGYMGLELYRDFCDIMNDHLREYSSTDLYDPMKQMLGITPNVYHWKGVDYYIQPVDSFNRPATLGLKQSGEYIYEYATMGIFVADNPITVTRFGAETNASIPRVGIGYVNYNGENRGKVFGILKGMTNMVPGVNVATDKGGVFYYLSSSPRLFGAAFNQNFLWRKQKAA